MRDPSQSDRAIANATDVSNKTDAAERAEAEDTRLMAAAYRVGAPRAVHIGLANPHEVPLVAATVAIRFTQRRPARLIGDKAPDSMDWTPTWPPAASR